VPELIAKTALAGTPPVTHGSVTLSEAVLGPITSIAAFAAHRQAVAHRLGRFPPPNSHAEGLVWTGPDQCFLIGRPAPDLAGIAAVTDQSGGWAALRVAGAGAAQALMRLIPLDLDAMTPGQAARTPLNHMQMVLMRDDQGFLLLVFRSMARTAWHEIETAMRALAARAAL